MFERNSFCFTPSNSNPSPVWYQVALYCTVSEFIQIVRTPFMFNEIDFQTLNFRHSFERPSCTCWNMTDSSFIICWIELQPFKMKKKISMLNSTLIQILIRFWLFYVIYRLNFRLQIQQNIKVSTFAVSFRRFLGNICVFTKSFSFYLNVFV